MGEFDTIDERVSNGDDVGDILIDLAVVVLEASDHLGHARLSIEVGAMRDGIPVDESRRNLHQQQRYDVLVRETMLQTAMSYVVDGNFVEGAQIYERFREFDKAVNAYKRDGSDESLEKAALISIGQAVDVEENIDYLFEVGKIKEAFVALWHTTGYDNIMDILCDKKAREATMTFSERQMFGEYFIRNVYAAWKDEADVSEVSDINSVHLSGFVTGSTDLEIIQYGLELADANVFELLGFEDNLRCKLDYDEEVVQAHLDQAEEMKDAYAKHGSDNISAGTAVRLLAFHGMTERALEVVDQYLVGGKGEESALKKIGDQDRLAAFYKGKGDVLNYTLTVAGGRGE